MGAQDAGLVSIVIPTLNEESALGGCLAALADQAPPFEIIVVDGGSQDQTRERAQSVAGVRVLRSSRGRARQMNAGAAAASGDFLWFLHADCRAATGALAALRSVLANPGVSGGAFRFALDGKRAVFRFLELTVALRARLLRRPYGDQGLFVRRVTFLDIGGFREVPVFEDVYFVRELRRRGRIAIVPLPLLTSARRWEEHGVLATWLRHRELVVREKLGASPEQLAARRDRPSRAGGVRR